MLQISPNINELEKYLFELGEESQSNLSSPKKCDCPVVLDHKVYAIPTMFVVDHDRKIIGKTLISVELRAIVCE